MRLEEVWQRMFKRVVEFVDENGNLPDCASSNKVERELGEWCINQRSRKSRLSLGCRDQMQSIRGWFWGRDIDALWSESFAMVGEFVKINGRFPCCTKTNYKEREMGRWCTRQRTKHEKGRLSRKEESRLESLTGWTWDEKERRWQECFDRIKGFLKQTGSWPKCGSSNVDERSMWKWCSGQRSYEKKGILPPNRKKRLESLSGWLWIWDLWDESFLKVEAFVSAKGRFPKCGVKDAEERRSGRWCAVQKTAMRKGKLSVDRQKKLESLSGWEWKPERGLCEW